MKVTIDCPVCLSGNWFELMTGSDELRCRDCGFLLNEKQPTAAPFKQCIFCGSRRFYYQSPLGLTILGQNSVCYVCGAIYRKARIGDPEPRFVESTADEMRQSPTAERFRERAASWH